MKIDPYKNKEKYLRWKKLIQGQIPDLSKENSEIILQYLKDMELGINISMSNKKGARSYTRLNTLRNRMVFLAKHFKTKFNKNLTEISENELCSFFTAMRNGEVKRQDGERYKSIRDYAKIYKAFWHWYQKIKNKEGQTLPDITQYLDTTGDKPEWVYLTEEQIKQLCDEAKYEYSILIMFLFDTGIRSPTELVNLRVSDLSNDFKELNIKEEISKTFGRKIKLMLCSDLIKKYVKVKDLKPNDQLFPINPYSVNNYLKRLGKRILGDEKSPAGQKYSDLTMYDFRHCSCCYWLLRYKSESALKFRFGWKKSDKIHYYSEMLGMRDTISEEDMLMDLTKTEIEKRLVKAENKNDILKEEVSSMQNEIDILKSQMKTIGMYVLKMERMVKE
ncbi:phage integrase family protein [Candidatus Pacearchaeota archaeon]|nr:phage integrase family protein [Candidatus Pacearchaeota archaeon]